MKLPRFKLPYIPVAILTAATLLIAANPRDGSPGAFAAEAGAPDPARVEELVRLLPESPRGVGRPIGDRAAWQAVAQAPQFRDVVRRAEKLLSQPMPELTDDIYLDYSRTGNRTRGQRVISQRHSRMPALVLAECLENRGRFLPAIETAIRAVCFEKSWTLPAHDRSLRNFRGEINDIDLHVAGDSWELATADYWLGDKLSPEIRKLIRSNLERRTWTPFESYVTTGKPSMSWPKTTNNWNAVCLAGVTGSALAGIESRQRRAFFVAAMEHYIQNFLSGFTPDGYCSEGVGYWNYGFGHYVMLAETIRQATGGKLDMMESPKVRQIALFGRRIEILPGIYPAFADCHVGSSPQVPLMAFLSRRFQLGLKDIEVEGLLLSIGPSHSLFELGLFGFANSASECPAAQAADVGQPLRDWFSEAGILICRPLSNSGHTPFGVALKGGHNAEHHNHNDVGSFVVALGKATPLVDPGSEIYTARTFSKNRYDSGVLNSFGHSVPRVAGQLQREGRSAAAAVLKTEFTDKADTFVMDIHTCYNVKPLKRLLRTFIYSREGAGSLTVIDEVELDSPQDFGTALITFSRWKRLAPNRLLVGDGRGAVQVEIAADGGDIEIKAEEIKEDLPGGRIPTRLGIDLTKPAARATIKLTIRPAGGA